MMPPLSNHQRHFDAKQQPGSQAVLFALLAHKQEHP
jgi:hypothetical protein